MLTIKCTLYVNNLVVFNYGMFLGIWRFARRIWKPENQSRAFAAASWPDVDPLQHDTDISQG